MTDPWDVWYIYLHEAGQIIATSAEVTPNGGLVRESSHNPLNSGLGIIVICLDEGSFFNGKLVVNIPSSHGSYTIWEMVGFNLDSMSSKSLLMRND